MAIMMRRKRRRRRRSMMMMKDSDDDNDILMRTTTMMMMMTTTKKKKKKKEMTMMMKSTIATTTTTAMIMTPLTLLQAGIPRKTQINTGESDHSRQAGPGGLPLGEGAAADQGSGVRHWEGEGEGGEQGRGQREVSACGGSSAVRPRSRHECPGQCYRVWKSVGKGGGGEGLERDCLSGYDG